MKEGSMSIKFKNTLKTVFAIALAAQLAGCIFVDRDRHGHSWHHEDSHDPSFDVRVHG
jgi:hypothetical protein